MIKLKNLLKEHVWDRKFGEPLPTLSDVMGKHGDCGCGGTHACTCESVTENVKDVMKAKKIQKQIQGAESRLRLHMYELADRMSADIPNQNSADQLIQSYQKNVTVFMRDVISLVKRMK